MHLNLQAGQPDQVANYQILLVRLQPVGHQIAEQAVARHCSAGAGGVGTLRHHCFEAVENHFRFDFRYRHDCHLDFGIRSVCEIPPVAGTLRSAGEAVSCLDWYRPFLYRFQSVHWPLEPVRLQRPAGSGYRTPEVDDLPVG